MTMTHTTLFSRSLLALSVAAVLSGCATTGPNQNIVFGTGKSFRMNGLLVSELQSDTFGPGVTRLSVKSRADALALDDLAKLYTRKTAEGLATGDAELVAVAWHLGKTVSKSRLEQSISTTAFLNSLASQGNGTATLPGGARVFLANKLYESSSPVAKRASFGEFLDNLALEPEASIDWSGSVKLAALGSAITGLINKAMPVEDKQQSGSAIQELAVGSAYSARDVHGNRYIIEKVADGIVLHNPDGAATKVDLNQLNMLPTLEAPAPYRKEAARILNNIESIFDADMQTSAGTSRIVFGRFSVPPNKVQMGDSIRYITADGHLAPSEVPATRRLYSSNQAYKLAVDLTSEQNLQTDPLVSNFRRNCSSGFMTKRYHGEALEYVTYSCRDRNNVVLYSQTYVISNSMMRQSWDSLLKDKKYVDTLKKAHAYGKLAEAAAAFVPGLGAIDAAAKCSGVDSLVYRFASSYGERSINSDVRKFISFDAGKDDDSAISSALDCAQGISGLGSLRTAITRAGGAARISGLVTSDGYKAATEAMKVLDGRYLFTKAADTAISDVTATFKSRSAGMLAASFYESAQLSNNLSDLAEAINRR